MKKSMKKIVITTLLTSLVLGSTACGSKEASSDVKVENNEKVVEITEEETENNVETSTADLSEEEKLLIMTYEDNSFNINRGTVKELVLFFKDIKYQVNIDMGEKLGPYECDYYQDGEFCIGYYNKADKEISVKDANIFYLYMQYDEDDEKNAKLNNIEFLNGQVHMSNIGYGDDNEWVKILNPFHIDKYSTDYSFTLEEMRNVDIEIEPWGSRSSKLTFNLDRMIE